MREKESDMGGKRIYKIEIGEACTSCGLCAKVCPDGVIVAGADGCPEVKEPHRCIVCGHCAAVCPSKALRHEAFPEGSIIPYSEKNCPSPEEVFLLCQKRRSNRQFTKQPIPSEMLKKVVEAAGYAPTATNSRNVQFTIVTRPEILNLLTAFTVATYKKVLSLATSPVVNFLLQSFRPDLSDKIPYLQEVVDAANAGDDPILHHATAAILIHAPKDSMFAPADTNLAYQNASLMAESLRISQFYLGYLCSAIGMRKGVLEKQLQIEGRIHAAMALGMPAVTFRSYITRTAGLFPQIIR